MPASAPWWAAATGMQRRRPKSTPAAGVMRVPGKSRISVHGARRLSLSSSGYSAPATYVRSAVGSGSRHTLPSNTPPPSLERRERRPPSTCGDRRKTPEGFDRGLAGASKLLRGSSPGLVRDGVDTCGHGRLGRGVAQQAALGGHVQLQRRLQVQRPVRWHVPRRHPRVFLEPWEPVQLQGPLQRDTRRSSSGQGGV
jgi:hypothetical protein